MSMVRDILKNKKEVIKTGRDFQVVKEGFVSLNPVRIFRSSTVCLMIMSKLRIKSIVFKGEALSRSFYQYALAKDKYADLVKERLCWIDHTKLNKTIVHLPSVVDVTFKVFIEVRSGFQILFHDSFVDYDEVFNLDEHELRERIGSTGKNYRKLVHHDLNQRAVFHFDGDKQVLTIY